MEDRSDWRLEVITIICLDLYVGQWRWWDALTRLPTLCLFRLLTLVIEYLLIFIILRYFMDHE